MAAGNVFWMSQGLGIKMLFVKEVSSACVRRQTNQSDGWWLHTVHCFCVYSKCPLHNALQGVDGDVRWMCVRLQVLCLSENIYLCLCCCAVLPDFNLFVTFSTFFSHFFPSLSFFLIFRQYKDKEEENQGGFFSTLTSMVGFYSYFTVDLFWIYFYFFHQHIFGVQRVCCAAPNWGSCSFPQCMWLLDSASVHRWAACS